MIIHSQTISKLTTMIQQKSIADIIETEQLILSGANEKLEGQTPQQVLKAVKSSVLKSVKEGALQEAAQIICLLLLCYAVPEKEYTELLKQV